MNNDNIVITINDEEKNEQQKASKRMKIIKGVIISFIVIVALFAISHFNHSNELKGVRMKRRLESARMSGAHFRTVALQRQQAQKQKQQPKIGHTKAEEIIRKAMEQTKREQKKKDREWKRPTAMDLELVPSAKDWQTPSKVDILQRAHSNDCFNGMHLIMEGEVSMMHFTIDMEKEPNLRSRNITWRQVEWKDLDEMKREIWIDYDFSQMTKDDAYVDYCQLYADGFIDIHYSDGIEKEKVFNVKGANWISILQDLNEIWLGFGKDEISKFRIIKMSVPLTKFDEWVEKIKTIW